LATLSRRRGPAILKGLAQVVGLGFVPEPTDPEVVVSTFTPSVPDSYGLGDQDGLRFGLVRRLYRASVRNWHRATADVRSLAGVG
jgi:hypothetical protein